ncbi:hypothetical protein SKAU_G00383280 [Synaphobranchus kaupii]|uniref:CIDE-N domain-containing protein n=1 Tax=Synaphobranchus kaupii TaxID=118154 RepID=A0A9Q1ICU7_SYNKA|nr:hypothetical protein SKAU_G00383280 [Synaphobranchus kaupii]
MEYAKMFFPVYVMRKVSLVGTSLSHRVLPMAMASPRPFKVSTHNRCQKKGVMVTSLNDLLDKTASAFPADLSSS